MYRAVEVDVAVAGKMEVSRAVEVQGQCWNIGSGSGSGSSSSSEVAVAVKTIVAVAVSEA